MRIFRHVAVAAIAGIALLASGCVEHWGRAKFDREVELQFLLPPGSGISAEAANGSVEINEVGRDDVLVSAYIRATTQERADAVQIVADASEAWLDIRAEWPTARRSNEGVSYVIEGPGGRPVRGRSSNGRIALAGFTGGADAATSNGAVTVSDHQGPVTADSSNGSITLLGVDGTVRASTSNGAVRVELAEGAAGPVEIDTSNGGVTLVVGPGFAGRIGADTSNGSISVDDAGGVAATRLLRDKRTSKLLQVGEGEGESTIDTSNGSIRITVRR